MKVDFFISNPNIHFQYAKLQNQTSGYSVQSNTNPLRSVFSPAYYVPFGCAENEFDKTMESLTNIHCPACGVKMIPKKNLQFVLEGARDIDNREDFFDFINANQEHISKRYYPVIQELNYMSELYPDVSLSELIRITSLQKSEKLKGIINKQIKYAERLASSDKYSDTDRALLADFQMKMADLEKIKIQKDFGNVYKNILKETIYKMDSQDRYTMMNQLRAEFLNEYYQKSIYNLPENYSENNTGYYIIKNLLRFSASEVVNITDYIDSDKSYNKILLCKQCEKYKKSSISAILKPDAEHLENYKKYISDISQSAVSGRLKDHKIYPVTLHGLMRKLSHDALNIRGTKTNQIMREPIWQINKSIDFDLVDYDGVPCACCGKPTVSHEKKLEIYNKIANAKDKFEILDILKNYDYLIKDKYKHLVRRYDDLLRENPNISDEEINEELKIMSKAEVREALIKCQNYARNQLKSKKYNHSEKIRIQQYIDNVDKYYKDADYDGVFDFSSYGKLLNNTFSSFPKNKKGKLIEVMKYTVKDKLSAQFAVNPLSATISKYDTPLKVIAQDIISSSVATKDHFVAKQHAGSNEIYNVVLLCKDCNQFKGGSYVYDWIKRDERVLRNFQNYFDYIANKVATGEMDSSKADYLRGLQITAYDASKGKIDVRYDSNFVL